MAINTLGNIFKITTFGESHGVAMGVVIDGFPSNFAVDLEKIQYELNRRKPGQSSITTERVEDESFEVLSGLFEGKTTGAPITFVIKNKNHQSKDYEALKDVYRPSHADYTYQQKFNHRDYRGGGRQSARETVSRVLAGALAKQYLLQIGISVQAFVKQVYHIAIPVSLENLDLNLTESNAVRCPHPETATKMQELIANIKEQGDSVGGIVTCICKGVSVGLGEPVFGKLNAALGNAILTINACKGVEFGSGFGSIQYKGSELNDEFITSDNNILTKTNHSGGIQGGISNGEAIVLHAAFKPVASIKQKQNTVNTENNSISFEIFGRHDPCVLPRAVPIVEAMVAIVLLDYYLLKNAYVVKPKV